MQNDAISRSALKSELNKFKLSDDCMEHELAIQAADDVVKYTIKAIKNAPALDVAPVVHAHWIKTFGSDGFVSTLRCSKCGNSENSTYIPGNFCWFCGARMDGESE